ncbi:MAG: sigma-54-dependent Fis family transcriptional regulator [Myxococcales bacterium]|nr:sigma-54-dependent Fis family transcriptional regulator [Myxococcales bacterium]
MAAANRALLLEDDPGFRSILRRVVSQMDFDVHEAERGDEGLRLIDGGDYHLVMSDYMMPGADGLAVVEHARKVQPNSAIVLITGYATVERAVKAMRLGADQVLEKPVGLDVLSNTIRDLMRARQAAQAPAAPPAERPELGEAFVSRFMGPMKSLLELLERISPTDCTVLIRGESGTGKELIARAIHSRSPRARGPFVPVNCGAIPENLLESELFGYCKGAFSGAFRDRPGRFAVADGGTIFLDEIGEMSPAFQVKLLRVLQDKSFEPVGGTRSQRSDFRVLAATHRDLAQMVREGRFREDLYYRLNVFELRLPPLRDRPEDIRPLVEHFIAGFNRRHRLAIQGVSEELVNLLRSCAWPGNVRELENLIERMAIIKARGTLTPADLPQNFSERLPAPKEPETALPSEGLDFYRAVEEFENRLILQALERTGNNKNRAASLLSLNRTTLVEKMKKKGLLIE